MIKKWAIGFFLCLWLMIAFSLFAGAEEGADYTVFASEGVYILSDTDGAELFRHASLQSVIDFLPKEERGTLTFSSVALSEDLLLEGRRLTLSGEMTAANGARLLLGGAGETELSSFYYSFGDCGIRLKEGRLVFSSGCLEGTGYALLSDYASGAEFIMRGGEIRSHAGEAAVKNRLGTVSVCGGSIVSDTGAAVFSEGSICLGGSPLLQGDVTDVTATLPLTLSAEGNVYQGTLSVSLQSDFSLGEERIVCYGAARGMEERISVYDRSGTRMPVVFRERGQAGDERDYLAVSLPYRYDFLVEGLVYESVECFRGETLAEPPTPSKIGYRFDGWYSDAAGTVRADLSSPPTGDRTFFAGFTLLPPIFSISSVSFPYDGELHELAFSELTHPLGEEGSFAFTWYKDGVTLPGSASVFLLREVSQSGEYRCRVVFTHGEACSEVMTPPVKVSVEKKRIASPLCEGRAYNGKTQTAPLFDTAEYTVTQNEGGCDVGKYPVVLTLRDGENCCFAQSECQELLLYFEITRAENAFCVLPSVADCFEGETPMPYALARFGEVGYLYSSEIDGIYTERAPSAAGTYYMRAVVAESENYTALSSAPISFCVRAVTVLSLRVGTPPTKSEYLAFEVFSPEGLCVLATFSDGSEREIPHGMLALSYPDGASCFHVAAPYLLIHYEGAVLRLPLSVSPVCYSTAGISLSPLTVTYDGKTHRPSYVGDLPRGADGSLPEVRIEGEGKDAGSYAVTLTLISHSGDHTVPPPMTATLTILPRETALRFSETSFVYTGEPLCPRASYIDVFGNTVSVPVTGAQIRAGDGYVASACPQDKNYVFSTLDTVFSIARATYELSEVKWSASSFVYDGKEKSVSVLGLPSGITLGGYADARATEAGEYTARVTLSYDADNYEPPTVPPLVWRIEKAEYPVTYRFSDASFVYDGLLHVPVMEGELPIGADGSIPTVSFDGGITDVCDGPLTVFISFTSVSNNYYSPKAVSVTLSVLPKSIRVLWGADTYTYTGEVLCPGAESEGISVSLAVEGGAVDAGSYIATARALSENYSISNDVLSYRILPAENAWKREQTETIIYESRPFVGTAEAKHGTPIYRFFSDREAEKEIDVPQVYGIYYVRAEVTGERNYLPLYGETVPLTLLRVEPISLTAWVRDGEYTAFDLLPPSAVAARILYNDGSVREVGGEELSVTYTRAESLRAGEECIRVGCLGLFADAYLTVNKRKVSLDAVYPSVCETVYDGVAHSVELLGLPSGFTVSYYENAVYLAAGRYTVTAHLAFDSENYEAESTVSRTVTVKKMTVPLPTIPEKTYNGSRQKADVPLSPYYTVGENEGGLHAGQYAVCLFLTDPANCMFSQGEGTDILQSFTILPRRLHYTVSDLVLYRGESARAPAYFLSEGEILPGEDPDISVALMEDAFFLYAENADYEVGFTGGRIYREQRLSPARLRGLLLSVLLLFIFLLLIFLLAFTGRRMRQRSALVQRLALSFPSGGQTERERPSDITAIPEETTRRPEMTAPSEPSGDETDREEGFFPSAGVEVTTAESADALITDALARELICDTERTVVSFGRRHGIVNVDTLSSSFRSGDRVDVNLLKEKALIPYDTGYLKVLARGSIDKPLSVYADDFSLQAVKMIALTGGEAIRARTVEREEKDKGK